MTNGNVKWFDVKKGFGFIVGPDGQDVFVHFSSISGDGFKTLKDGESVEYVLHQGDKGWHAREVRRIQAHSGDGHSADRQPSRDRGIQHLDGAGDYTADGHSADGHADGHTGDGQSLDISQQRASSSAVQHQGR